MKSVLEYPPHISIRDAKTKKLWIKDKLTVLEKRIESLGIFTLVDQGSSQKEWYRSFVFVDEDSITYQWTLEFRRLPRKMKTCWIAKYIQVQDNRQVSFEEVLTSVKNPKIKSVLLFNLDLFT